MSKKEIKKTSEKEKYTLEDFKNNLCTVLSFFEKNFEDFNQKITKVTHIAKGVHSSSNGFSYYKKFNSSEEENFLCTTNTNEVVDFIFASSSVASYISILCKEEYDKEDKINFKLPLSLKDLILKEEYKNFNEKLQIDFNLDKELFNKIIENNGYEEILSKIKKYFEEENGFLKNTSKLNSHKLKQFYVKINEEENNEKYELLIPLFPSVLLSNFTKKIKELNKTSYNRNCFSYSPVNSNPVNVSQQTGNGFMLLKGLPPIVDNKKEEKKLFKIFNFNLDYKNEMTKKLLPFFEKDLYLKKVLKPKNKKILENFEELVISIFMYLDENKENFIPNKKEELKTIFKDEIKIINKIKNFYFESCEKMKQKYKLDKDYFNEENINLFNKDFSDIIKKVINNNKEDFINLFTGETE